MSSEGLLEVDVMQGLNNVINRIAAVCSRLGREVKPRLVAVSKTKPEEMIISAYNNGQRHFGENYIQELVDKSTNQELNRVCEDIRWHFIGNLQRNKVNKLVSVPGLYLVETVDSDKLASTLDTAWGKLKKPEKLNIFVQINTSQEKEKNGCSPEQATELVKHIVDKCPNLKFKGLMTIGRFGYDYSKGPNPDFLCLKSCRDDVCDKLGFNVEEVELSMGMSDDFEHAIELGSTNVRVGSSIFGVRKKKDKPVAENLEEKITAIKVE